jgi:outer membrane protein
LTAWGMEAEEPAISPYDLVVIGSGPAGQKGAIAAAKLGNQCPARAAGRALLVAAISLQLASPGATAPAPAPPGAAVPVPSVPLPLQGGGPGVGPAPAAPATPPEPAVMNTPVPPPVVLPSPPAGQSVVPTPADQTNRPLTADEAARIALARQPSIGVASGQITTAQGVTRQQRSGLLPSLGLSTSYSHVETLKGNGGIVLGSQGTSTGSQSTANQFQVGATLRQLIYDFNHTRELVQQARAQERAAAHNLTATQANVVLQVKQAFYQYVQFQQLVTVNEQNVANRQAQLALANARFRVGLGLASDVANAQTAVSAAVQNLTVARNNASLGQVNLAVQMGIDPRTPIQPAESGEPPLASDDVSGFVQTALRQRPEILLQQATLQADQHALKAAKTFNAPIVSTNLGVNGRGSQFFPQNDAFTVGAAIQFDLFDGGLTAGRIKQARGNLASAQSQLLSEQIAVTSDVSQAYLDVRTAEQRVVAAGTEVVNAREGVRIATGRYQAGLGLFQDILTAQQALYTALTDQVNAQAVLEQARAAFSRAVGSPVAGP